MAKRGTISSAWINHLGLIRGTFVGAGNLKVMAFSSNDKAFRASADIVLVHNDDKLVETLSNFKKQKIQIEFALEEIDEYFTFGDVIAFIKPVESGYPRG